MYTFSPKLKYQICNTFSSTKYNRKLLYLTPTLIILILQNQMSLKGRGQGVDLGTSTLSLMRSIFFSFLGLALPYDPLNIFPLFVLLSPRPHRIGDDAIDEEDNDDNDENNRRCSVAFSILLAAEPHHCIFAISRFLKP